MNNLYFEEYKRCKELSTLEDVNKTMASNYRELADSWWRKWIASWTTEDAERIIEVISCEGN